MSASRLRSVVSGLVGAVVVSAWLAGPAGAGDGPIPWVSFDDQTATRLVADPALGADDVAEKDYAWGDVDNDGDVDLVVVRKEPGATAGLRRNVLFINQGIADGQPVDGVLVDMTEAFATAASDGGMGFLDPTNDRDVRLVDVNLDGWLDIVTATAHGQSLPKTISHSRVYVNLGEVDGVWQGFFYDEPRIPQLAAAPNASAVAAGDVDDDGYPDLYYTTYQITAIEDHLLLNDGTGSFINVSGELVPSELLVTSYAINAEIVDMNGDSRRDIVRCDHGTIEILYNAGGGVFDTLDPVSLSAQYHVSTGELNGDGLPDIIEGDDGQDRFHLNLGPDAPGQPADFSTHAFTYFGGGFDDGFTGNSVTADLDHDGANDVLIADVDVDVPSCGRRMHVYRNLGDGPEPTLQEQQFGNRVVGIPIALLRGTHDVAVFDLNGDGRNDLVMGRCATTEVWINHCPSDVNADGVTDVDDLVALILAWGTGEPDTDLDGDGITAVDDLILLILGWGPCA